MVDYFSSFKREFDRINTNWNRRSQLTHVLTASILLSFLTYFIFDASDIGLEHSLLISFLVVVPSVMFHELMHVKVAKELGYSRARYVAYLPFLLISCGIVLFFKAPFLLLPGFATISIRFPQYPAEWYSTRLPFRIRIRNRWEEEALIALGGLIANICLILISLLLLLIFRSSYFISSLIATFLILNFNLLAFNMLPIPIFDGSKVFKGNKKWFAHMWIIIIILGIASFLLYRNIGVKLLL